MNSTPFINPRNKIPLYHQLFLVLESKIIGGEYAPGDYLPSERELSDIYKVSRITATRTLNELALSGMVVRETGRGTRVRPLSHAIVSRGAAAVRVDGSADGNESIDIVVDSFGYEPSAPDVAAALDLEPGAPIQRSVRLLHLSGEPFAQVTAFVAADIGRRWTAEDLAARPLYETLGSLGYAIQRSDEVVTATLADMGLASQLALSPGAPLIKIVRTTYGENRTPIEHLVGLYRPDRYQYRVSLTGAALPGHGRLS